MFGKKRRATRRRRVSRAAFDTLKLIPGRFVDDGCSYSPDSIMRADIGWACRIHDWRGCTRAQSEGLRRVDRKQSNRELRKNVGLAVPWYVQWTRVVYYFAVTAFGNPPFNSCGPEVGDLCRHNMPQPLWMENNHA